MTSIPIGAYLLIRLKQVGIDTIFGVPDDFNMPLLDFIEDDPKLTWANNTNELNAAYAADGYARIRGIGALVTTFGVGELSAINGVAGSYSELVPVIHIVGAPRTNSQAEGNIHHTLGNDDFDVFYKMNAMVTVASAKLTLVNSLTEIDRVIQTAFINKRPGYIKIPFDLINAHIEIPLILPPLQLFPPKNPEKIQSVVIKQILNAIIKAKHPIVVVDGTAVRHGLIAEVDAFVKRSGFLTLSSSMAKGALDESLPNYRGIYSGDFTYEGVKAEIKDTDLLIEIGPFKCDLNTGGFSYGFENTKTITLNSFSTIIYHAEYTGVGMHELLPLLTAALPATKNQTMFSPRIRPDPIDTSNTDITHNYLWNKLPEYIAPNSILVCETGSASFGVSSMNSLKGTTFINQLIWASIGYSIGAAVGAAFADRNRKVYLFVGDGSFQLTFQDISVFIRQGLTPVIFLLNNNGYLTEKLIHGRDRKYNTIQMWNYSKTLEYFGGNLHSNKLYKSVPSSIGLEAKVTNRQEFEGAMELVNQHPNKIHFLEVFMPDFDTPYELSRFCAVSESR